MMVVMHTLPSLLVHHPHTRTILFPRKRSMFGIELVESECVRWYMGD